MTRKGRLERTSKQVGYASECPPVGELMVGEVLWDRVEQQHTGYGHNGHPRQQTTLEHCTHLQLSLLTKLHGAE